MKNTKEQTAEERMLLKIYKEVHDIGKSIALGKVVIANDGEITNLFLENAMRHIKSYRKEVIEDIEAALPEKYRNTNEYENTAPAGFNEAIDYILDLLQNLK